MLIITHFALLLTTCDIFEMAMNEDCLSFSVLTKNYLFLLRTQNLARADC